MQCISRDLFKAVEQIEKSLDDHLHQSKEKLMGLVLKKSHILNYWTKELEHVTKIL